MSNRPKDDAATNQRFAVHVGGYRWSAEHELSPLPPQGRLPAAIRGAPRGPWLVSPAPWGPEERVSVYALSRRRRDLHLEFARLTPGDEEESLSGMLRFANRFGMLGVDDALVYPRDAEDGLPQSNRHLYFAEHLSTWRQAISTFKGLNELIHACKAVDLNFLREHVNWSSAPLRVGISYQWPGHARPSLTGVAREGPDGYSQAKLKVWSTSREPERYLEPMLDYLYSRLNEELQLHVAPRLSRESQTRGNQTHERGVLRVEPKSLLGALYVMAAEQLAGIWPTKACASCGVFFVPRSRRDQLTCGDACRKRLSRARDAGAS
jgi:hypothetical protein